MGADARLPGRVSPPHCPVCHGPPGPDCPDKAKAPRAVRRELKRETDRLAVEAGDDKGGAVVRAEYERVRDGKAAETISVRTDLSFDIDGDGWVLGIERIGDDVRFRDLVDVIEVLVMPAEVVEGEQQ